jgi:hypothetical protein
MSNGMSLEVVKTSLRTLQGVQVRLLCLHGGCILYIRDIRAELDDNSGEGHYLNRHSMRL